MTESVDVELGAVLNEKTNYVASAYGRGVGELIRDAAVNNGICYFDNKKITALLTREGLQLPAPLAISDYINSMHQNTGNVNTKVSNQPKTVQNAKTTPIMPH